MNSEIEITFNEKKKVLSQTGMLTEGDWFRNQEEKAVYLILPRQAEEQPVNVPVFCFHESGIIESRMFPFDAIVELVDMGLDARTRD